MGAIRSQGSQVAWHCPYVLRCACMHGLPACAGLGTTGLPGHLLEVNLYATYPLFPSA
jgi:hypothetical protein